jgi:radical SAM superfamily enzyme YgiQ (UPF0313 family)
VEVAVKVLLVQPDAPYVPMSRLGAVNLEPLALEYIAGAMGDEAEVRVLDLRVTPIPLQTVLTDYQPDVVGLSCSSFQTAAVLDLARDVRATSTRITTVVGGYHPTLQPQDFHAPEVDYCCRGEGVAAMREVIARLARGSRPLVTEIVSAPLGLDYPVTYPLRARLGLHYDRYVLGEKGRSGLVQTSSGCPYRCSYCDVVAFNGGRYLTRNVTALLDDILDAPAPNVVFADDESFLNAGFMSALTRDLRALSPLKALYGSARASTVVRNRRLIEGWKASGLAGVFIGFDAIGEEDLRSFDKKSTLGESVEAISILHDCQIDVFGNFIILPRFSSDDFKALGDFMEAYRIDYPSLTILTPLPGTPLWDDRQSNGNAFAAMDLTHLMLPTAMPRTEFLEHVEALRRRVLG